LELLVLLHCEYGYLKKLNGDLFAFISHERTQVVNQYLYLHFPTQSM